MSCSLLVLSEQYGLPFICWLDSNLSAFTFVLGLWRIARSGRWRLLAV